MAALDQAALSLANSLAVNDIPIKLRCTTCNKLAINAFKLPCCDQSICDTCQSSLPETCPVCAHSPLDGAGCKQNKSLRLTIKAFLKSEEKKRSKDISENQPPPSATPVQVDTTAVEVAAAPYETLVRDADGGAENPPLDNATVEPPAGDEVVESVEQISADQALDQNCGAEASNAPVGVPPEEDAFIPQESVTADPQPTKQDTDQGADQVDEEQLREDDNGDQNTNDSEQVEGGQDGQHQQGMQNMMGFNPMMQMGGFGGFNPMMGMNGMGMNPMNMPFNGFGGMSMNNMNGMNMGMNFGGNFGGWNGQGMGGNFGPGYYPQGGYNQHQMHQMHNQQFPNRNFQNRFRGRGGYGRGRGGFAGRGGHFNQFQNQQNGYNLMGNGMSGGPQAEDGSYQGQGNAQDNYEAQAHSTDGQTGDQADLSAQFQPGDAADHGDAHDAAANGDMTQAESTNDINQANAGEDDWEHTISDLPNNAASTDVDMTIENDQMTDQNGTAMDDGQNGYMQDQSNFDGQWNNGQDMSQDGWGANNDFTPNAGYQDFNQQNYGFGGRGRGRGGFRGGFRGRGGYQGLRNDMQAPKGTPLEPPINAPTGPKAMREGLPNSGKYSRPQITQPSATPAPQSVHQDDQLTSYAVAPSERGRSPSRTASDRDRKRKHRDRSHSASTQDHEANERRRERRRRHEDKYSDSHGDDDRSSRKNRSRSRSAGSSDRRQRRRDKERYKSTRSSHRDSSHRRHRSRSPRSDEDTDRKRSRRDRDKEYDRDRDRDRDRRRSHRHRSRSTGRDDLAKRFEVSRRGRRSRDDGREKDDAAADANDVGFKIKGSRSAAIKAPPSGPKRDQRRESVASKPEKQTPTGETTLDHYALEREARHRERVLKEQQRRESAVSKTSGKRGRDDGFDPPNGPRDEGGKRRDEGKRRGGVFYEDELDDGRGEREREGGRW